MKNMRVGAIKEDVQMEYSLQKKKGREKKTWFYRELEIMKKKRVPQNQREDRVEWRLRM